MSRRAAPLSLGWSAGPGAERRVGAPLRLTDQYLAGIAYLGAIDVGVSDLGPDGSDVKHRDILVVQIAECARYCGHADLLRERIDCRMVQ